MKITTYRKEEEEEEEGEMEKEVGKSEVVVRRLFPPTSFSSSSSFSFTSLQNIYQYLHILIEKGEKGEEEEEEEVHLKAEREGSVGGGVEGKEGRSLLPGER